MTIEIIKPTQTTYFITWDNEGHLGYGEVTPKQEMTSGLTDIWQTLDKAEFVAKLLNDYNITYEEII